MLETNIFTAILSYYHKWRMNSTKIPLSIDDFIYFMILLSLLKILKKINY